MTTALAVQRLQIGELFDIVLQAKVLQRMSEHRLRQVVVDYVPARQAMSIIRDDPSDEPLEAFKPVVIPLTFTLDDAMFGGVVYVSLVCGDRVIINPFAWQSYEHLGKMSFNYTKDGSNG